MKRLSLLMTSLVVASTTFATTYVRVEKDGSKTYSDRPLPGGQPVELQPAQTYSAPPPSSTPSNVPSEQQLLRKMDDFSYTNCSLSPGNDESFTNPESVPVSVTTEPAMRPGDVLQLSIDGKPIAPNVSQAALAPAYRGTHTAQVTIKNSFGRVLCSSSVQFHVFQPSVNMPGRGG